MDINMDLVTVKSIFDALMNGSKEVAISTQEKLALNAIAQKLYNISDENYTPETIEELKYIILNCNILYNRTDMEVLPIEDGFYDLLLEKYKKFDPHFQVGSYVVNFDSFGTDFSKEKKEKEVICPIEFINQPERDELRQSVHDKIMRTDMPILNRKDFHISPISFTNDYISKRSHNTKHNHTMLVGTLDKSKFVLNKDAIEAGVFNDDNVKVLERDFFRSHIAKGIYSPDREINIVCELKYDGLSVEADCGLTVQSARSRGDTCIGEASDMTPILKDYIFKQADCMIGEVPLGVKFEAIMTKSDLYAFNIARGKNYANCRTAIIGMFGASDAYLYRDYITLVPLALDTDQFNSLHPNTPITNRLQEIEFINKVFVSHGEPLRYCYFSGTVDEILYLVKVFTDEAKIARNYLNFMYDGIVVSYLDNDIREKLGRENYINKFSMAVKFDAMEKQTTFRGYTYEVGQHGNITPMIHYDPVEFNGTIHTKSSGSSYDRFKSLNLKMGDIINVTYVNDVMPYVSRVDCKYNRDNPNPPVEIIHNCPVCGAELVLSNSEKTLLCPNTECPARTIQRMTNMFAKLNIKGFANATFTALNKSKLSEIANMSLEELVKVLGDADGLSMYTVMNELKTKQYNDYFIIGALGFTSVARKKWQDILQNITVRELYDNWYSLAVSDIPEVVDRKFEYYIRNRIPNIGEVTATVIAKEFKFFAEDIKFILDNVHLIDSFGSNIQSKGQIRFSGFRNQQLVEQLITAGYDADDNGSVSKTTDILLVPYIGFESSKTQKAKKYNVKIMTQEEFLKNIQL